MPIARLLEKVPITGLCKDRAGYSYFLDAWTMFDTGLIQVHRQNQDFDMTKMCFSDNPFPQRYRPAGGLDAY